MAGPDADGAPVAYAAVATLFAFASRDWLATAAGVVAVTAAAAATLS